MTEENSKKKKSAAEKRFVERLICFLWGITVLFAAFFVLSFPKWYCIFPLIIAVLLPPIVRYQRVIKRLLPHKWMKPTLIGLLLIAFVVSTHTYIFHPKDNAEITIASDSDLEVHFIDVGQGDATLVTCDNHCMLIDGGSTSCSNLIYSYLSKEGIDHLDYIVCSHPHEDHVGGLSGALNLCTVDTAFCSITEYDSKAFQDFCRYLSIQNVELEIPLSNNRYSIGKAYFEFIGPVQNSDKLNNMSLVIKIVYGETTLLIMADAEEEEEKDILLANKNLKCDVIRIGHHGSDSSNSKKFLAAMSPKTAIITVGKDNEYGHPSEKVTNFLLKSGIDIYRTDVDGDVICRSDGSTISITTEKY